MKSKKFTNIKNSLLYSREVSDYDSSYNINGEIVKSDPEFSSNKGQFIFSTLLADSYYLINNIKYSNENGYLVSDLFEISEFDGNVGDLSFKFKEEIGNIESYIFLPLIAYSIKKVDNYLLGEEMTMIDTRKMNIVMDWCYDAIASYPNNITVNFVSQKDENEKKEELEKNSAKKPTKKKVEPKSTCSIYSINNGEEVINKALIPNLNLGTEIIVPKFIEDIAKVIKGEIEGKSPIRNILLYGESGTGKSFSVKILSQLLNLPYYAQIIDGTTDKVSLCGGANVDKGTVTYNDSVLVECFVNGGVIELQEIYNADASELSFLNSALEEGFMTLPNGKTVFRNPKCIIIATSNISYAGCKNFDFSTDDRFTLQKEIIDIDPNELKHRVMTKSGNDDSAMVNKMIKAYFKIKELLKTQEWDEGIVSVRKLISWAQVSKYKHPIEAAEETFLSGISKNSYERETLKDNVLLHLF